MEGLVDGNNLLLSSDLNPDATAVEKAHTHFSASVYATTFFEFCATEKKEHHLLVTRLFFTSW